MAGKPWNLYGPSGNGISLANQAVHFLPPNFAVAFWTLSDETSSASFSGISYKIFVKINFKVNEKNYEE